MNQDCIFCKIVTGDIPNHTVYEDDEVLAFMDIDPINEGMTLVIPRKHIDFVHHMDNDLYQKVMAVVKDIMLAIEQTINPARVGLIVEGYDVDHAHIKIVPLQNITDIQTVKVGGKVDHEKLEQIAQSLRNKLT